MIPAEKKSETVKLIQEAVQAGARLTRACTIIEISVRTYQRWKTGNTTDQRKGAPKRVPRKLTDEEKDAITAICCNEEFIDATPYEIYITLVERSKYYASISTMYRILRERKLVYNRRNTRIGVKRELPMEGVANGPNQVWSWDITWLPTDVKGIFLYSYMILDIWDKTIVGWEIHDREESKHSESLFRKVLAEQGYPNVHIHSDNGNPMKGVTLLSMLYELGCKNSFSRPRVSNDNAFSESFFGRMKTSIKYPGHFESIFEARAWMADFINWYNTDHRHSGIEYFTPQQMRTGENKKLLEIRNTTLMGASKRNPSRWSSKVKQWSSEFTVYLNPSEKTKQLFDKSA